MCVIYVKPYKIGFVEQNILENCFNNNSDGAGFCFWNRKENCVEIRKGFMSFKGFWYELQKVRKEYGDKIPYICHFRISTQGGINKECTHPFPLSENMTDLKLLQFKSKIAVAHNGIIDLCKEWGAKDYSDTMKYVTEILPLIFDGKLEVKNLSKNQKKLMARTCKSKLAMMDSKGNLQLIGKFEKYKGCYFSNDSYEKTKIKYNSWYGYYGDDDSFHSDDVSRYSRWLSNNSLKK